MRDLILNSDTNIELIFFIFVQGSVTGAFSPIQTKIVPSFILLAVQGSTVVCYVYELINDNLEVSKTEFTKKDISSSLSSY